MKTLDKETNDKLNTCVAKVFAGKFAPDATAEARGEVKTILAGHADILRQVDAWYFRMNRLWLMHEFPMSEAGQKWAVTLYIFTEDELLLFFFALLHFASWT